MNLSKNTIKRIVRALIFNGYDPICINRNGSWVVRSGWLQYPLTLSQVKLLIIGVKLFEPIPSNDSGKKRGGVLGIFDALIRDSPLPDVEIKE